MEIRGQCHICLKKVTKSRKNNKCSNMLLTCKFYDDKDQASFITY